MFDRAGFVEALILADFEKARELAGASDNPKHVEFAQYCMDLIAAYNTTSPKDFKAQADNLLGQMLDLFKRTDDTNKRYVLQTYELSDGILSYYHFKNYRSEYTKDALLEIDDFLLPVVAIRSCIMQKNVKFEPADMKNFHRFADTYRDIVMVDSYFTEKRLIQNRRIDIERKMSLATTPQ